MKLLIFVMLQISVVSNAQNTTNDLRLKNLENRITSLEQTIKGKLSNCELKYKHYSYSLNHCDRGTFTRSIIKVGNDNLQLECGYYELSCIK